MDDCRSLYACVPVSATLGKCQPKCNDSTNPCTGTNQVCRACDGLCVHQSGNKAVGEACASDTECPIGGICRKDINGGTGDTTGTCVVACGGLCASTCPDGASCMHFGTKSELLCFHSCQSPSDCRPGFGCWQEPGRSACKPACTRDQDCGGASHCVDGSCLLPAGPDGGCILCGDGGKIEPGSDASASDAGTGSLPSGCGCSAGSAVPSGALLLAALLALSRRRRTS